MEFCLFGVPEFIVGRNNRSAVGHEKEGKVTWARGMKRPYRVMGLLCALARVCVL